MPVITYDDQSVRDILTRVRIDDLNVDVMSFLPYTISEFDKPWTVAHDYYDSVDFVWLVYLSNNITDPIYGWYLDSYNFESYLTKKYGSVAAAQANLEGYKDTEGTFYTTDTYTHSTNPDKSSWLPIYSYAREDEDNENKKIIKLLDKNLAGIAERNLVGLLNA